MKRPLAVLGAGLALAGLILTGRGSLPGPPIAAPARMALWWQKSGPVTGLFALGRTTLIGAGLVWLGLAAVRLLVEEVLAIARRLGRIRAIEIVQFMFGTSTAITTCLAGWVSSAAASPLRDACVHTVSPATACRPPNTDGPLLVNLDRPPTTRTHPRRVPPVEHAGAPGPSRPAARNPVRRHTPAGAWVVNPGDSLWSIAESTLAANWGRPPSDKEVASYWEVLIATNRSRLPVPDDPGLIFPGDRVTLPPVGSPPHI